MLDDLKFAFRRLRHAPGFAIVAVLTLAVAVGANTAILSIADGVLFRPLPFKDPDRVFLLQMNHKPTGRHYTLVRYSFLQAINSFHKGVGEVGDFGSGPRVLAETAEGTQSVSTLLVSPAYFRVLGVQPRYGRVLSDSDTPGRTAILTYAGWQKYAGGDPAIIGRTLTLGASSFDVVGVLPAAFIFPSVFAGKPDLAIMKAPAPPGTNAGTFHPVVRLEPGVTREQAQAEVDAIAAPIAASDPQMQDTAPFLENIRETIYPVGRPIMAFLLAAASLVLLVGCANLANMLLARGRRYERETAVRTALGASRVRLVRPLVFEAIFIGLAASALALLVTVVSFDALQRAVPAAAFGNTQVGVDMRVVLAGLLLGLAGGLIFAVVPAWRSAKLDVLALIQGRHRTLRGRARVGRPMVAAQVALAVVLVFGAAVATRAFMQVLNIPLGFDSNRVARIAVAPAPGTKDIPGYYLGVVEALRSLPELEAVGGAGSPPLMGMTGWSGIRRPDSKTPIASVYHVIPGYFEAVGMNAVRGRSLTREDADGTTTVLSESAARVLFPGAEPVGQIVDSGDGQQWRVVGVVPDVRLTFDREPAPPIYVVPVGRTTQMFLFARVRAIQGSTLNDLKRNVSRLAPGVPTNATWWSDEIGSITAYKNPRFQTMVLGSFAAIALGLTALGIFGVVAFVVAARTREMGIRVAIGAAPGSLVRLVVQQALLPVGVGLIVGIVATRWAAKLAEAQLYKVDARDPWTLALTASAVVLAAMLAAYLPARRAARVDPIIVLRAE